MTAIQRCDRLAVSSNESYEAPAVSLYRCNLYILEGAGGRLDIRFERVNPQESDSDDAGTLGISA